MLIHAKDLTGYTLHAADGDIGDVRGLYFDCGSCNVRYLAVRAGGRERLIPIDAANAPDFRARRIHVNLSKDRILNSPDVDLNLPVSRDAEIQLRHYHGLPLYSESGGAQSDEAVIVPEEHTVTMGGREVAIITEPQGGVIVADKLPDAQHLFGTDELTGYRVKATDGEVGRVYDFLVDDGNWSMRYLIIDTDKWLNERKLPVAPEQVDSISRSGREVRLDVPKEDLRTSPEYDISRTPDEDYQRRLREHYAGERAPGAYEGRAAGAAYALWRFDYLRQTQNQGKKLRIVTMAPAIVHWSSDNWRTSHDTKTMDTGASNHIADLDTDQVPAGNSIRLTFFWPQANKWEGRNFSVRIKRPAEEREPAGVR